MQRLALLALLALFSALSAQLATAHAGGTNPAFSDWVSLGNLPGAEETVDVTAVDADGNLYIGGGFDTVGNNVKMFRFDPNVWVFDLTPMFGCLI